MHSTFIFSLLASAVAAQLTDSNLEKHVGSLALSAPFNPVKAAYWTDLPHHRRTPFAVSPDGKTAYLAYLDASEKGVHVQQVNPTTFAAVGAAVTVAGGKEAGGLVAHNDGFALLTNEAMPAGTSNAPADNTPVTVLYRYTSGKQTFKTWLGGPAYDSGMGNLATSDINGDLVYSEASGMYGAYFVVTAYSGSAKGHFGDAIQYVNKSGARQQIPGASSGWGCSHNTGILFEAADSVPFASMCAEDQGAIWLNTGDSGMNNNGVKVSNENVQNGASNEPFGGTSGSYSGLARFIGSNSYITSWVSRGAKDLSRNDWMGDGYTKSANRTVNRNVAIATFSDKKTIVGGQATSKLGGDGDAQVNWITKGSADCQNAHVAAFDGKNALVTWEEIAEPTCEFIAMGCKGKFTGAYYQLVSDGKKVGAPVKSMDTYVAGDMVTMKDGRICWPYVDMKWNLDGPIRGAANVKAISFACMKNGAGSGNAVPAATAASKRPAAGSAAPVKASAAAGKSSIVSRESEVIEVPTVIGTASYTVAPELPTGLASPSFAIVIPGATITPPALSLSFNLDLPMPSLSFNLPASESFVQSEALAFTDSTQIPNPTPGPESEAAPTETDVYPISTVLPVYSEVSETPTALPSSAYGPGYATNSVDVPLSPIPTALPSSAYGPGYATNSVDVPLSLIPTALPSSAYGSGYATGSADVPLPTGTGRPGRPSYGSGSPYPSGWGSWSGRPRPTGWGPWAGRPRPTGWGSFPGHPRPTGRPSHPHYQPEKYNFGVGQPSSTPCTLEKKVKPTAAPAPGAY